MDLRPRNREPFSGFTKAEIERMEHLLKESKEQTLDQMFCKKLAKAFSYSKGRAGKPVVKWTEVQNWFQNRLQNCCTKDSSLDTSKEQCVGPESSCPKDSSLDISKEQCVSPESCLTDKIDGNLQTPEGEKAPDLSKLEFEARSPKDGAWYDVDTFLAHRFLKSGESEVLVRYVGFGPEEDEWVTVGKAVRERSVPLENSECLKVKVGDLVVCFQDLWTNRWRVPLNYSDKNRLILASEERQEQARYFDAHVLEIHRRLHDIRGCRCVFLVRYEHDYSEEKVHLNRLCYRPNTY